MTPRPLRAILLVLLAVALLAFLQFFRSPGVNLLWLSFMDAGHVPLFGVFALVMLGLVRVFTRNRKVHPLLPYAWAFVLTGAVSALTEVLQYFTPRDADVVDLARSVAGAAVFLLVILLFDRSALPVDPRRRGRVRLGILAAIAVLLAASLASVTRLARAYVERARAFPRICEFQSSWEKEFYDAKGADLTVTSMPVRWRTVEGNRVARVSFRPGKYPGFHIHEMCSDWRGYDRFCLDVYSESAAPRELILRLHDQWHDEGYEDRFNREVTIRPGKNSICIPLAEIRTAPEGRAMDLSHMEGFALFADHPDTAFTIYLDAIRLER